MLKDPLNGILDADDTFHGAWEVESTGGQVLFGFIDPSTLTMTGQGDWSAWSSQ